jgi:hypothetical protein
MTSQDDRNPAQQPADDDAIVRMIPDVASLLRAQAQADEAPAAQPRGVFFQFANITAEIESDGTMMLYAPTDQRLKLNLQSAYELYLFMAKMPAVGALLERAFIDQQNTTADELEQDSLRHAAVERLMAEMEPAARRRIEWEARKEGRRLGQEEGVKATAQLLLAKIRQLQEKADDQAAGAAGLASN